jgi:hypothetical protein
VNENGDEPDNVGVTVPAPFSVMVTAVAEPPNVFPLTVTGVIPQVLPEVLLKLTSGGFAQPQATTKLGPVVVQPADVLTVIV